LEWFNKTGGSSLDLRMGVVGNETKPIPPSFLATIQ